MARESIALLALAALLSCRNDPEYEGAFEVPIDAAVLPTNAGPFTEPIGLVANAHGGQIATLALKQGRFLTDDPSASFLRGNWLPTGGARILTSVAVWAPDRFEIHAFAGDRRYEHLIQIPWIVGSEQKKIGGENYLFPVEQGPTAGEPCFLRAGVEWDPTDGSACPGEPTPALENIELKHGYSASETWFLTWNSSRGTWVVEGTRSGRQEAEATPKKTYKATRRRVGFTVTAGENAVDDGDRIAFTVDSGLIEHDVGGSPEKLAMSPDQTALAMIVHDRDADEPVLRWFDPATAAVTDVALPAGSRPTRLAWTDDGSALWVADAGLPVAWELAPGATTAVQHDLPWPILDVAPLFGDTRQVFVVPDDGREVWIFDADTDEPIDINASLEGDQGMFFGSPVTGIAAIPLEYTYQQTKETLREQRLTGRSVAVALHSGRVVFMEEETGCLVQDSIGPRTTPTESGFSLASDVVLTPEITGGPAMVRNAHNDRHVLVNPCAGVARDEAWQVRYDGTVGAWRVISTTYREHANLAYEDQRYVSDNGEVSFTIRAGSIPTQDSWEFQFTVDEGALTATGDVDGDGVRETILGNPGDPVFYHYLAGRDDQTQIDWRDGSIGTVDGKTDRAYVLLPSIGSDNVGRINPETGIVEARWD